MPNINWSPQQISHYQNKLLDWFMLNGRHDLPWKVKEKSQNQRLYEIWVSEVMLQQTQVITVIPYFHKFIQKFPTIMALAQASQDDVLSLWSGLGYYARARNLHKTAQIIEQCYQGIFPDKIETIIKLPGIGQSTAAAILAQGLNAPYAILDGNVRRILSRVFTIQGLGNTLDKYLWPIAQQLTAQNSADYTQALMDLGANICKKKPLCPLCPLSDLCQAYKNQTVTLFPNIKPKKDKPNITKYFLFIYHEKNAASKDNYILLEKRPDIGVWGGLWCLPEVLNSEDMTLKAQEYFKANFDYKILKNKAIKHVFTHFNLTLIPVLCIPNFANSSEDNNLYLNRLNYKSINKNEDLTQLGLAKPILKLLISWQLNEFGV